MSESDTEVYVLNEHMRVVHMDDHVYYVSSVIGVYTTHESALRAKTTAESGGTAIGRAQDDSLYGFCSSSYGLEYDVVSFPLNDSTAPGGLVSPF